ncbi:MAG: hypothetical protein WCO56_05995 [Verrucomicrobiota bacterium]
MKVLLYVLLLNDQVTGPYTQPQIQAMVDRQEIALTTLYAEPGHQQWRPVSQLLSAASPAPAGNGHRWKTVALASALLLVAGLAAGVYFSLPRTPKSAEPPPPNVSYKKWQKTANLTLDVPLTAWEKRLGRNLHQTAYHVATNFVGPALNVPEAAVFEPYEKTAIQGVDWRFRVHGRVHSIGKKTGEPRLYEYDAYLKRGSNEQWSVECLEVDKKSAHKDKDKE